MTRTLRLPAAARHPSRWTLRTKLLAGVLVLFTIVMLATSALTVVETRRYLDAQLAKDLQNAVGRSGDRNGDRPRRRRPHAPRQRTARSAGR